MTAPFMSPQSDLFAGSAASSLTSGSLFKHPPNNQEILGEDSPPNNQEILGADSAKRVEASIDAAVRKAVAPLRTFSKKLFRCGLTWRKVSYFDEQMCPKFFTSGYSRQCADFDPDNAYLAEIDDWRSSLGLPLYEESELARREKHAAVKRRDEEFLARERERDAFRRQRKQRTLLKDLVNKNYLHYMYTFTFALEGNGNVRGLRFILESDAQRDRDAVEQVWNTRLTSMRRTFKQQGLDFKYVKVLERHTGGTERKDGRACDPRKMNTFHIHLATNIDIGKWILQELWGYGIVDITNFNEPDEKRGGVILSPGDYMAKYMDKDFDEADAAGKRAFSPSQNLIRPEADRDDHLVDDWFMVKPALGFTDFDKERIEECEQGLFAKIETLADIEEVKVFDETAAIEFEQMDAMTGGVKTVKMFVRYEIFNFRLLMTGVKRQPQKPPVSSPRSLSNTPEHDRLSNSQKILLVS
jgi:hypothetical protein